MKDPLSYLKDRYQWTSEENIRQRLNSHLIPVKELSVGINFEEPDVVRFQKIKEDFFLFINRRAELIYKAGIQLCEGRNINFEEISKTKNEYEPQK
jgi:hypothetical protein